MHNQLMKIRKAKGYKNRDDFADYLGINRYTYRSWESGSTVMNAEQVCLCAEGLGCTPNDIVGWYIDHPEYRDKDILKSYTDSRQELINGCYETLNEQSKDSIAEFVKSYAADPARRVLKDGREPLADSASVA